MEKLFHQNSVKRQMKQYYKIIKIVQAITEKFYKNQKNLLQTKATYKMWCSTYFLDMGKEFWNLCIVKHTFVSRNKPDPFLQVFLWMNEKLNQSNFLVTHEQSHDLFCCCCFSAQNQTLLCVTQNIFLSGVQGIFY